MFREIDLDFVVRKTALNPLKISYSYLSNTLTIKHMGQVILRSS